MKAQLTLITLLAAVLFTAFGNNIPGLWTGYKTITNDGTSITYSETITFTDTELVHPHEYQTMCNFHGIPSGIDVLNFDCTCIKLTSAVDCVVNIGTTTGWTDVTLMIGATSRDDIRMGHFSRSYVPPIAGGTINEYLSFPWVGTPNQADMYADVYISGLSSNDDDFSVDVSNPHYDVATNQIQFDLAIVNHDNGNLELTYSYIVSEDSAELEIEVDLDVNTVEVGLDEVNGMT